MSDQVTPSQFEESPGAEDWRHAVGDEAATGFSAATLSERFTLRVRQPHRRLDQVNSTQQIVSHRVFLETSAALGFGFEGEDLAARSDGAGDGQRKESDVRSDIVDDASGRA